MNDPPLEAIDRAALRRQVQAHLDDSRDWPVKAERPAIVVRSGRLPGLPVRAYRTDLDVEADVDRVVRFIADDMFVELPRWNREFVDGEVLEVLDESDEHKAWLMRVFYATPWPLANREYLYLLERWRQPDGSVLIAYQSVESSLPVRDGYVRGSLTQTVHRACPRPEGGTRLEHILVTDIAGSVPQWTQSHLFAGGFVAANLRDALAQQSLLSSP